MKTTRLFLVPLFAASTLIMAAPVSKKTELGSVGGTVNQLGNLQVIIGTLQFINETFQSSQGATNGNCDPDKDGKADGSATKAQLSGQPIDSVFLTSSDTNSFNITRRTWNKCAVAKIAGNPQDQTQVSITYLRTGSRDSASQAFSGGRTISFNRFGESAKKPLLNTLNVAVGGFYTDPRSGKKKKLPSIKYPFNFKTFYQLETLNNNTGDDTDALLYEGTLDFAKSISIIGSIGDTKGSKTAPSGTPFRITRNSNNRITQVNGLFGVDIKASSPIKKQITASCPLMTVGGAKVLTASPLTTSGNYGGFGTFFNTFSGFTGGELRFSDGKTDCSTLDDKNAASCAVIKFNADGTMDVKPAKKGATAQKVNQNAQYEDALCVAGFILAPVALFGVYDDYQD